MASDKATNDSTIRDMIAEWVFLEFWHSDIRPSDEFHFEYIQALMNLAGADGVLADEERKWILGNQAAKGTDDDVLNHFKTYMPTKADLDAMIADKPKFTEAARRSLIFEAFLAACADNDLNEAERDAINRMGRAMGMDDTLLQQLEHAAIKERIHRRQVVDLVFPQGLKNACDLAQIDLKKNQA